MPLAHQQTQILKDTSVGMLWLLLKGEVVTILQRLGIACENAVQLAFATRGFNMWAPDFLATVARKTARLTPKQKKESHGNPSNSPLIDTGQLRRSISSKVEKVS